MNANCSDNSGNIGNLPVVRIPPVEDVLEASACAIKYVLDRAQTNREFGWQTGPGTEAFRLLVLAESALLGVDPTEHEKARSKQYWPPHGTSGVSGNYNTRSR